MAMIGIDLGTTNSLASVWKEGACLLIPNSLGEIFTPSAVSLDEKQQLLVGQVAKERMITHPDRTAAGFKRYMGTKKTIRVAGKAFRPEELSSFVLRKLKQDAEAFLGEEVTEAVVSVPAYFHDSQRAATKLAGTLAGLRVDRIINEPSAAALAYRHKLERDGTFVVFDFGGGTLDISVVDCFENITEILAVAGDNYLGGDDVDAFIEQEFYRRHPQLKETLTEEGRAILHRQAEQCKVVLSYAEQACMMMTGQDGGYEMILTREELLRLIAPLLERIRDVLRRALADARRHIREIDEILLVGGSSNMRIIQDYLRHLTGKRPVCSIDPTQTVAVGVGIVSGIKSRDQDVRDLILTDLCPFTLGTEVHSYPHYSPIIERNCPLPASNVRPYVTVRDNQTEVLFKIFQGDSLNLDENVLLGSLKIAVPPRKAGEVKINVRYTYDINGILEVEVYGAGIDQTYRKVILQEGLGTEEAEQRLAMLQSLKTAPREEDLNRLLIARAKRLFAESTGAVRELLLGRLMEFEEVLSANSPTAARRMQQSLEEFLTELEQAGDVGL